MNKHIFLCTDDPGVGGAAQYNHSILCELAKLGYRVTCIQPQAYDEQLTSYQKQLGIQHVWISTNKEEDWRQIFTEPSNKPDLIFCSNSNPFSNFAIKQNAIQIGIPYIIVEHLVEPHLAKHFSKYLDELSHHYTHAKSVIAVSYNNLSLLYKLFRLPENKGQVIYNGRPSQYFTPCDSSIRILLRQELSIPFDAVVCFTAARIETRKGYQYQLEAIKQLIPSLVWSQLYFIWAGAGIFEPQLEKQLQGAVEQLGITKKVLFLGQRLDVSNWLNAADIFIFPSQLEGMPLCVMEAMAKGLPVIASAVSGIPEELGNTGKLLPDPKIDSQATIRELVTAIQEWVVNPSLRYSIGQACKQRAEKIFREERMIKETAEVIERALLPVGDNVFNEITYNHNNIKLQYHIKEAAQNQENKPLVSVVIPCYNQARFLPEAVASVVAQIYDNWEIIIVNDGSPDDTTEVAKQLITLYPQKIRLIEKENGGVATARNAGIAAANGEYILPLDADDKLSSTAITNLLEVLLNNPIPCVAFGSYQMFGIDQRICISVDFYSVENIKRFNMLVVSCLYPKTVWALINGYKTDINRPGYEDWDFWLNCHHYKIPFYGTREIVLYYRKQSTSRLTKAKINHGRTICTASC